MARMQRTGHLARRHGREATSLVIVGTVCVEVAARGWSSSEHSRRRLRVTPQAGCHALTCQQTPSIVQSESQSGRGVVGPGLVDTDIAAECGQGAVAGLMGAVAGAAGVVTKPAPEAVGAVRGGVDPGAGDGLLDQGVDRVRVQRPIGGVVVGVLVTMLSPAAAMGSGLACGTGSSARQFAR